MEKVPTGIGLGLTAAIVGPEAAAPTMLKFALPHWLDATATIRGIVDGTVAGALYRPVGEIVPSVAFPPRVPLTIHVTGAFSTPFTVAEYCIVPDTPMVA